MEVRLSSRTFYRLRPGVQHPAFRAGELYRLIERTYPDGYVVVELHLC